MDPDTSDPTDNLTERAVEFCQSVGSTATTVSEVVGKDVAVYRAIEEGIQRVNRNAAARPYRIQKWALLGKDFSIPGGELGQFSSHQGLCGRAEAQRTLGSGRVGTAADILLGTYT